MNIIGDPQPWVLNNPLIPVPTYHLPLTQDLNPLRGTAVPTFTRSTTGTYVDKDDGLVKTAAIDVPRFETDGLLIEGASTNLLVRSEEFDGASWPLTRAGISANATTAPDSTSTADKLIEDTSLNLSHVINQSAGGIGIGNVYRFSCFAKAAERSHIVMGTFASSDADGLATKVAFDINTGTVGETEAGTNPKIESLSNGWYRCSITMTASSSTFRPTIYLSTGSNLANSSYTGDGSSGVFIWGAQLEKLPFASSYIPTTTTAVTRTADACLISASGFLRTDSGTISITAGPQDKGSNFQRLFEIASAGSPNETVRAFEAGSSLNTVLIRNTDNSIRREATRGAFSSGGNLAVTYGSTNAGIALNGVIDTVTDYAPLSMDTIAIGSGIAKAFTTYGHFSNLRYYNIALVPAQLQRLIS